MMEPCFPNSPKPAAIAAGIMVRVLAIGPVRGLASQPSLCSQAATVIAELAALVYCRMTSAPASGSGASLMFSNSC